MKIASSMQQRPLKVIDILSYASRAHPTREIVSRLVDEPIWRYGYKDCLARAAKAANALKKLGVGEGDRVATLAWNTHRHFELFFAVPGLGAVLCTVNPRLFDEQIVYILRHAEARTLLFDRNFLPVVERIAERLSPNITFIMLSDEERYEKGAVGALCYERVLLEESDDISWPEVDENSGAFLCYTSGTTGEPKGVAYSPRSIVLHAMAGGLSSGFGLTPFDVVMPCSSLYHATAWGLPFTAPMCGSKLVLPCDKMDGASLQDLIAREGVTISGGVPTIWTNYLAHLEETGQATAELQRVVIGGSAVPRAMAAAFKEKFAVRVLQIWGMTETSPLGVIATPTPALADLGDEEMDDAIWSKQGRLLFGIELKIVDDDGNDLPWDGQTAGALLVRGPWVVERYYRAEASAVDSDSWFDTGDIATLDENGYLRLTDRAKDVIKSGGEWISSIDIENIAAACDGVRIAAVIGVPHEKWEERPVLIIEAHPGSEVNAQAVLDYLKPRIVKWWTPDAVIFDSVPLTATGKIDKKILRKTHRDVLLG